MRRPLLVLVTLTTFVVALMTTALAATSAAASIGERGCLAVYSYDAPLQFSQRIIAPRTDARAVAAADPRTVAAAAVEPASRATTGVAAKGAPDISQILLRSPGQLQSKFKHAGDFGVAGNYSKANAARFSAAINQHINAAGTRVIQGTYRGESVTHYLDPSTGLNVISRNGEFISGWRLNPDQLANVLRNGSLGGG